jgi:hypothetical protein
MNTNTRTADARSTAAARSARIAARLQAQIAAAEQAHKDAAAYVKARAVALQLKITPQLIASTGDPVLANILRAQLAKATSNAADVDARLSAGLATLATQMARVKAHMGVR